LGKMSIGLKMGLSSSSVRWLLGDGKMIVLLVGFLVACCLPSSVSAEGSGNGMNGNETDELPKCEPGLLFPVWEPQDDLSFGDRFARGLAYFLAMLYMFIGVSIISDRFMASIEVITSKEKEVRVKRPNGEIQIVVVRVWNETVANLTLMALGSSAPEILLSIIEIYAKDYESGDLGPGTIVGSAAFNLLVIIAICVYVIPNDEVRRIKHLRVFFVTATWSVFAYLWLLVILKVTSPGVVDLWEGIVTFLFFPATVLTAYLADRRIYKFVTKQFRIGRGGMIVETEGTEMKSNLESGLRVFEEEGASEEIREFEQSRRDYITMLRELRKKNPNIDADQLETMAREEILNKGPKSRAFYRMQATRKLVGGQNLMKKMQEKAASDANIDQAGKEPKERKEDDHITKVFFDPGHYTVLENVGQFKVTVVRDGGDLNLTVLVDYKTEDGTASGDQDYVSAAGTVTFAPGETTQTIQLEVIDDDVFEEDEHFYVRLTNARFSPTDTLTQMNGSAGQPPKFPEVQLSPPFLATVIILDDDHCGVFNLDKKDIETVESIGTYDVKVSRWSGARGRVVVPYETEEGTAKPGKDYVHVEDELIFENNDTEKYIQIQILEEDSYEKDEKDESQLTEDEKIAIQGLPKLGSDDRCQIRVKESKEFKNTVDKLLQRANASMLVGTSSWKEQFIEAITVSAGEEDGGDEDEEGGEAEEKVPSCGDYVMHFLTIFWKIIFACVPPTDIAGGYVAFVVSIIGIGLLTAVIGDLASHLGCTIGLKDSVTAIAFVALGTSIPDIMDGYVTFVISILMIGCLTAVIGDLASHLGCTVGLKDSVTAIAFVALGTSVPDTFASKVAAIQDEFADASVGNVTGSNAVNVFLGIGIAWSIAAFYHEYLHNLDGCVDRPGYVCGKFNVDPGSLAYSVFLFCSCAGVAIFVMLLRRLPQLGGGELGGPPKFKYPTSILFFCLWLFYVTMSSLEAYGHCYYSVNIIHDDDDV
ncbi:Sodium/calcium exchanger 2, partial [Orchesella cincta]